MSYNTLLVDLLEGLMRKSTRLLTLVRSSHLFYSEEPHV